MSGDSRWSQTERDEDAYEDAWYRALKAKSEHRFPDPGEERTEAATPPPPDRTADGDD
jgi:hypothetical protein